MINATPQSQHPDASTSTQQRILVALDRGDTNSLVLQKAQQIAQAMDGELMLCHCLADMTPATSPLLDSTMGMYGSPYTTTMLERSQELLHTKQKETISWLRSLQAELSALEITTEFDAQPGEPGRYICQLAMSWQADLIVVGRRGRSGISELLLGSVSNHIVHHAPCSVLVVQ